MQVVRRIADGHLDTQVNVVAGDTTSVMAAVEQMQQHLKSLVREIADEAVRLSGMSSDVARRSDAVVRALISKAKLPRWLRLSNS
jgi:methyl-accepting chemotaxis protein